MSKHKQTDDGRQGNKLNLNLYRPCLRRRALLKFYGTLNKSEKFLTSVKLFKVQQTSLLSCKQAATSKAQATKCIPDKKTKDTARCLPLVKIVATRNSNDN